MPPATEFKRDRVAVLYQAIAAPVIDGVRKPMKRGGYTDSGADIAYVLRQAGIKIATPVAQPRPGVNTDWVFPDDQGGIEAARQAGAGTLWANTILFAGHPLQVAARGLRIVGQRPEDVQIYDDKWVTNSALRTIGLNVARSALLAIRTDATACGVDDLSDAKLADLGFSFPLVLKPVRGRGSQGVVKVDNMPALVATAKMLLGDVTEFEGTKYPTFGHRLILEEYLLGDEITITVMPPGTYSREGVDVFCADFWALPAVGRFNHDKGIAPYAGNVAVSENSHVLPAVEQQCEAMLRILEDCVKAARVISARAPIRIDCRRSPKGDFRIFDLNMKPNMTGAGRPGRENQDSLTCLAARAIGWSYADLLVNMMRQAWLAN